jgi:hypothetical protein
MRTILILLVLANVALFAYARLDRAGTGEAARLAEQVQPEKLRLLTPQQVAALGPAKVAALADVCLEWGPFNDTERARALSQLEPAGISRLLSQRRIEAETAFWVHLPRSTNRAAIDKRVADLKAAGVKDVSVVDATGLRFTIALGAYRAEEAARAAAAELRQQGVADVQVGPRQQTVAATQLVIRDPEATVVTLVRALQPAYPGSAVRIGSCEKLD